MKKYNDIWNFNEGFTIVKLNNKWGFIDKEGKEICDIKYDYVWNFNEGFAKVKLNNKYGFINKEGKEICDIKYVDVLDFKDGLALVVLNNKLGFINEDSEEYFFDNKVYNLGSREDTLYYTKYKDTYILHTGCFIGDLDKFEKAVEETHGNNKYGIQYKEIINNLRNNIKY